MKARIKPDGFFGGVRTDEWLQANKNFNVNGQLVSDWQLTDVLPDPNIKEPIWNGNAWIESLTPEVEQQRAISQMLENEQRQYEKRIEDGRKYYAQVSAEFRLARLSGQLSNEQHAGIENIYRPVRDEILAGQWLTAKELATAIDINIVGADIYNKILDKITEYVAENY
jgi:hypothetical protein